MWYLPSSKVVNYNHWEGLKIKKIKKKKWGKETENSRCEWVGKERKKREREREKKIFKLENKKNKKKMNNIRESERKREKDRKKEQRTYKWALTSSNSHNKMCSSTMQ